MVYGVPRGAGSRARLWGGWLSLGGCRVCVWGCLCWNKGGCEWGLCVGACSGGPGASHTRHPLSDPLPGLVPKALGCSDASFGSKIAQDLCRPLLSCSLSFLPAEFPCNAPPLSTARIEWGLGAAAMGSCSPQEPGKLGKNGENDEPKLNPLQACKGRDYQGHR